MRVAAIGVALLLSVPACAGILDGDDCRYTSPRRAATPAAGITKVVIHADAGSLNVDGTQGAVQIVAAGTACTSDDDFLERITLTMSKRGSELHIDANIPGKNVLFGFFSARLDFAVTLPAGLPVSITDDSGWMKVANTGATTIDDDSGAIEVRNVRGNLVIHDDSGAIDVDTVSGDLEIEDDSGDINVRNVNGSVAIEDDSGSITVQNVRRDVTVHDDGSGSIDVADVGGNFRVGQKSSGAIDYARVAGNVSIPARD